MTRLLPLLEEAARSPGDGVEDAGFGSLATARGHLPLRAMDVRGRIDGLLVQVTLCQTFVNATDEPLEATYIFPLPDRAAVTGFRMEAAGRVIEGVLEERSRARREYAQAALDGHYAAIAEEERPGVFTLRVGNLMPAEEATVRLTMAGVLPYHDGEVTFRFPLVVPPRFIPGRPLPGPPVGDGVATDTDAVSDASRIAPPVLLPGFPNPVRLSLAVELHEWAVALEGVRVSLQAAWTEESDGVHRVTLRPGERLDRDFILRFRLGGESVRSSLSLHPDTADGPGGTFVLTLIPPAVVAGLRRGRGPWRSCSIARGAWGAGRSWPPAGRWPGWSIRSGRTTGSASSPSKITSRRRGRATPLSSPPPTGIAFAPSSSWRGSGRPAARRWSSRSNWQRGNSGTAARRATGSSSWSPMARWATKTRSSGRSARC